MIEAVENPTVNRLAELRPESTNAVNTALARNWKIPGDQVARGIANFSEEARDLFKWLARYADKMNLSPASLGGKLRNKSGDPYSADAIMHVYYGRREEAELAHMLDEVRRFRKTVEAREGMVETGFVETALTRAVFRACERAFLRKRVTFIFGESQVGKTTALEQYERTHNHGETILVRMPTRGALGDLLDELAIRLNIPTSLTSPIKRRRILDAFDDRTLLIVDECHQCLVSKWSHVSLNSLEFCREIHDRRKCGLVLCGTNVFRDGMQRGAHSRILRQLWLRGFAPLQLPASPSAAHLGDFARAFGLKPAGPEDITTSYTDDNGERHTVTASPAKLERTIADHFGLGRWVAMLQEASDHARERGKPITWGFVIAAHERFQAMEQLSN